MAATTMAAPSSASGLLAMLNEPHPAPKLHALDKIISFIHLFWPEISTSVPTFECLYEDEEFEQRQLAALVASKVFYYLGELNDSLSYALGAGPLFNVSEDSDYSHTLLAKALDEYANLRSRSKSDEEASRIDLRLEAIVERMLEKCISDEKYQQAMGMAVECRRLDKLEEAITRSDNAQGALAYCINLSHTFVHNREYRSEMLPFMGKCELYVVKNDQCVCLGNEARQCDFLWCLGLVQIHHGDHFHCISAEGGPAEARTAMVALRCSGGCYCSAGAGMFWR